ncbi:MAG TPA: hypothetical protein VF285_04900 [Castellaniella sp.]|uniref:hypothetical protein n=1 Tax=Castellaniella sp. TaxID=1955812 RepID=UPI002EE9D7E0
MKDLQNIDVRLTDALERELLQEAIDNQQSYAFDRAISHFFHKVVSFFNAPEVQLTPHTARTAH